MQASAGASCSCPAGGARVPPKTGRSFPLILLLKGIRILYAPMSFTRISLSAPAGHSWPVNPGCLHLLYRKSASLVFAIHICICQNLHVCRLSFAFYCLLFALSACRNFTVNPNCRQFGQDAVRTAPLTRTLHLMILSIQLFVGSGGVCVSDSKEHS